MAVIHLFDQPLKVARPYEGYIGNLVLPKEVVEHASDRSILINYHTPRHLVMEAIQATYPGIKPEHVHVWTLAGGSRQNRLGTLWQAWQELGAHLVEDGWLVPQTGMAAFTESGTYAPSFRIGPFTDNDGQPHVFICDGYAASAEAMQAASLDPILGTETLMALFSSKFEIMWEREHRLMHLDPEAPDFGRQLSALLEREANDEQQADYREMICHARDAGMPMDRRTIKADDFFPNKQWKVLALASYMLPDPYSGAAGVEELRPDLFRVTTHAATRKGMLEVKLSLRLMEPKDQMRLVFSPLLDRFYAGQDYHQRAVKVSDSGRIRNELHTLCSEAVENLPGDRMKVHFDQIDDAVLPGDKKRLIREVLEWYKAHHPFWFRWLQLE
jgi:hypothetical protein